MIDSIGDRFKRYELTTQSFLNRRTYTIIRIDGKAFHTYTKGLERPFDDGLIADMDATAIALCEGIQGAKLAYVQSDEISVIISDFDTLKSDAWYDYNIQKITSISASIATAEFNKLRLLRNCTIYLIDDKGESHYSINKPDIIKFKLAQFDSRVFQVPTKEEVINYLIWRQKDATRNSISSVAQALYSHKELNKKNSDEKQEMIFQAGTNWNDFSSRKKRGGVINKVVYVNGEKAVIKKTENETYYFKTDEVVPEFGKGLPILTENDIVRTKWESVRCPIFTQDRNFFNDFLNENI